MTSKTFLDFLFPQFHPDKWQAGISLHRSDAVQEVSQYSDVVSAKVVTGMGEKYKVHAKMHRGGKMVQWMECSCSQNRRHNEKCEHLVALFCHLNYQKVGILQKLGIEPTPGEKLFRKSPSTGASQAALAERAEGTKAVDLLAVRDLVNVDLITGEPCLAVAVKPAGKKKVSFRLGVQDAPVFLAQSGVREKASARLKKLLDLPARASHRIICKAHGKGMIKVKLAVLISCYEQDSLFLKSSFNSESLGTEHCFVRKYGFVPFLDNLEEEKKLRWLNCPDEWLVEGDAAAELIASDFKSLRDICDVQIDAKLLKSKVYEDFQINELRLSSAKDGQFAIKPKISVFSQDSERGDDALQISDKTLIDILKARAQGKKYVSTKKGWLKVKDDFEWVFQKLAESGEIRLGGVDLIRFRERFAKNSEISGAGEAVRKLKSGLISGAEVKAPDLHNTSLKLRSYQDVGYRWLWWLYENNLGGVLADEMGLGKTHQAMALIAGVVASRKESLSLVVCPTSVMDHWMDKLNAFLPGVPCLNYHGPQRKDLDITQKNGHLVVVTSYGILLRDVHKLVHQPWELTILDEAHLVKNQTTRTYQAINLLQSKLRLCLTGTPLENNLMELKNLFDFVLPSYLGSDADFKKRYMSSQRDILAEKELQRLVQPFKLRRNKLEVARELPDKVEDIKFCRLGERQKKLYSEVLALKASDIIETLKNEEENVPYIHVFSVISLLKQICNDPGLLDPRYNDIPSGKLELFEEILDEALRSQQKVVVFTQYAKMIKRLESLLARKKIAFVSLTGASKNRGQIVKNFQEGDISVFLGSLLAGGTGIDLTAANVVIHFDRWWNAAKENQATDRVHRIGQTRNVLVYKLVTRGTLEEKIDRIIRKKADIFERYVESGDDYLKSMSREELLSLLSPLTEQFGGTVSDEENEAYRKGGESHESLQESHNV